MLSVGSDKTGVKLTPCRDVTTSWLPNHHRSGSSRLLWEGEVQGSLALKHTLGPTKGEKQV